MTDRAAATDADHLQQLRAILAAIMREAANRGLAELVDLAKKADRLAWKMTEDAMEEWRMFLNSIEAIAERDTSENPREEARVLAENFKSGASLSDVTAVLNHLVRERNILTNATKQVSDLRAHTRKQAVVAAAMSVLMNSK